jgi:predicted F0F1-ATPase subunit
MKRDKNKSTWKSSLAYLHLGWEMALPVFIGVLLGNYLDKLTNSKYHLSISLLFAGVFISYLNLARIIKRINKDTDDTGV